MGLGTAVGGVASRVANGRIVGCGVAVGSGVKVGGRVAVGWLGLWVGAAVEMGVLVAGKVAATGLMGIAAVVAAATAVF